MQVGTILLTKTNKYVKDDGSLPVRPDFDKGLLAGICDLQCVSNSGYDMLPPSIQQLVHTNPYAPTWYDCPITIPELANANLLIVSRSPEDFENGKTFRFVNFELLVKDERIELWKSL